MGTYRLLIGDCREMLRMLPEESVHCVVTSPPYWGLRDYRHDDQLGLEPTPEEYVANMVEVFREVRRVLRSDGTLWLNLGDSYNAYNGGAGPSSSLSRGAQTTERPKLPSGYGLRYKGLKPKDLVGIPWRVAFALQADGWYLRSDIIWAKPNPMPESVRDRPTKAHEYVFLLSKSERYYYDAEAVKEPAQHEVVAQGCLGAVGVTGRNDAPKKARSHSRPNPDATRNARSVWTIATRPYHGAHFATFPPELAERCIRAGTSERGCCPECGAPWERVVERPAEPEGLRNRGGGAKYDFHVRQVGSGQKLQDWLNANPPRTIGWRPTCECNAGDPVPCMVLDPFAGSGTVGMVATGHGRHAVLIELNPDYAELIRERIGPMLEVCGAA